MKIISTLKPLFWYTLLAWVITLLAATIMGTQENWSPAMIHQKALGFHYGGTSPIIAIELADSAAMIQELLPANLPHGIQDRAMLVKTVTWDFGFIVGYASLLALLVMRQKPSLARRFQLFLVGLVAVADGVENLELLAAMGRTPSSFGFSSAVLVAAAKIKWMYTFLLVTLLGYAELTQSTYRAMPAFWRCLSAILMLVGGLTGLWWMFGLNSGLLIQNGFSFILAALGLMLARFLCPDGKWCRPRLRTATMREG